MKAPTRDGWFLPLVLRTTIINQLLGKGIRLQAVKAALDDLAESSLITMNADGDIWVSGSDDSAPYDGFVPLDVAAVTVNFVDAGHGPNRPEPDPIVA